MSVKYLNLEQGSPEWLAERRKWMTASDAPSILAIRGAFRSRDAVLKEKVTGESESVSEYQQNLYDRGHAAEVALRQAANDALGIATQPAVAVDESIGILASIDGINLERGVLIETKYSTSEKVLGPARRGEVWEPYYVQIQAQLLVTGLSKAAFFVMDAQGQSWIIPVLPDAEVHSQLRRAALEFLKDVRESRINEVEIQDTEMKLLRTLLEKKRDVEEEVAEPLKLLEETEKKIDAVKKLIAKKYAESVIMGFGVRISKSKPSETLDRSALEKAGIDLKPFMKLGNPQVRAALVGGEE